LAKFESSHFDEILCDPRYTLLAFVNGEVGPVNQFSVDLHKSAQNLESEIQPHLFQSLGVIIRQFDSLPHIRWRVSSFNRLHIQI